MKPPMPSNSGDLQRGVSGEHRKSQSNMRESIRSNWPKESPPEHTQVMTYNMYSPLAQHWNSRLPLINLEIDPKKPKGRSIFPGTSLESALSQPRASIEIATPPLTFSEAASKMFPKRYKKHITYADNRKIFPRPSLALEVPEISTSFLQADMAITSVTPYGIPSIKKEIMTRAQWNSNKCDAAVGTPASTFTNLKTVLGGGF